MNRFSLSAAILAFLSTALLSSCVSTNGGGSSGTGNPGMADPNHPLVRQRAAEIGAEPRGDYWIGRRWWTQGTRFWGYLRRPGEPWSDSKLVVFNESRRRSPDRLPEQPLDGRAHGFDHNYEYRIYGQFSGKVIYDPNSNLELPEFSLENYELISQNPGFLFQPGERYNPKRLPPKFPPVPR